MYSSVRVCGKNLHDVQLRYISTIMAALRGTYIKLLMAGFLEAEI